MDWQTRRKVLYLLSLIFIIASITVYLLRDTIFPKPTCSDGKQNGFELGVDCGGTCALRCSSEVQPLVATWVRFIKSSEGKYDLVALVSNKNINNAVPFIKYTFTLYDEQGGVLKEVKGSTVTPINGEFPIIRLAVPLIKAPSSIAISFEDGPHYSVAEKSNSPTISVGAERYEIGDPFRVYVSVRNNKRATIKDLPVNVLLYDQNNNVYAVNTTSIPQLGKEEVKEVSFVWNQPTFRDLPVRIKAYPILNPFLRQD